MSDMQGNPHHDEARRQLEHADADVSANWATNTGDYKADMLAAAQTEATLALAFEQRTANLLAAFAQLGDGGDSTYLGDAIGAVEDMGGKKLAEQIAERLGLK